MTHIKESHFNHLIGVGDAQYSVRVLTKVHTTERPDGSVQVRGEVDGIQAARLGDQGSERHGKTTITVPPPPLTVELITPHEMKPGHFYNYQGSSGMVNGPYLVRRNQSGDLRIVRKPGGQMETIKVWENAWYEVDGEGWG